MEQYLVAVIAAGAVILLIGIVALVVAAFRTHPVWGFGTLFVLGAPFFAVFRWSRARRPVAIMLLGGIVMLSPYAFNYLHQKFLDLGERDKIVDGERHLTLTGWNKSDYSVLTLRPDTVVLQMANPDVTDATLDFLQSMDRLRELDLNDTKITDAGLAKLNGKPLVVLRLRNTGITDAGFREHLGNRELLNELDVRGTAVEPGTFREWRAAKPGRRGFGPGPRPDAGVKP